MKAVVCTKYGPSDVLELTEVEIPTPQDDQVLVKVHAASVNPADWHILRGEPYIARLQLGLREPKDRVLGCDVAGRVEAVGKDVTMLRPGAKVFGSPFMHGFGAFAEYVCVSEDLLAPMPATLSFEQAATVPLAASTALQGLRDHGRIEPGQKVLIVGASGGVGTFAVQIAKYFDAEVSGVCSTRNVEMVRSLGADHVIDYTREDFTRSGRKYDLIFQLAGTRSPSECRRALTSKGTLVAISGDSNGRWIGAVDRIIQALVLSPFVSQKLASLTVKPNKEDLRFLKQLVEAGTLTPLIDRTYPLGETPEAIRYLESGHARGKVVITVIGDASRKHGVRSQHVRAKAHLLTPEEGGATVTWTYATPSPAQVAIQSMPSYRSAWRASSQLSRLSRCCGLVFWAGRNRVGCMAGDRLVPR
jgi:NADPH:quinone reductase-like Zn-dependent oxidoreductase